MNLKLLSLLVAAVVFFTACNNQKNDELTSPVAKEKITLHNLEDISNKIAADSSFSQENIEYFINAITRVGAEKDSLVGKTIAEIISSQKKFLKDRTIETLKNSGARISLFLNHTFHYAGINFNDADKNNKINNLVFDIKNTSDKVIKKVEGRLFFYTPNGELVKLYNLVTATEIPVNTEKPMRFSMPFQHLEDNQRDKIIRESTNLRAVWTPTLIEFADGTKIEDKATKDDQFSATNKK